MKKVVLPKYFPLKQLKKLQGLLGGSDSFRLAGGCVRDLLYKRRCGDIDIATKIKPNDVISILNNHSIKTIPTGIEYGSVTALVDSHSFEITTLRQDINCDGRRTGVKFSTMWEEDSARRDFTINAMYLDLEGNVYDYHNGLEDLEKVYIRFVGNPKKRVQEDYLRILRYFRFYSYLDCREIHAESFEQCKKHMHRLRQISGERIRNELLKLLKAPYAKNALLLLAETDFYKLIGLEVLNPHCPEEFSADDEVNLALMQRCFVKKDMGYFMRRLKLSNKSKKGIQFLCDNMEEAISSEIDIEKQHYMHGKELTIKLITLKNCVVPMDDYKDKIELIKNLELPKFPITGEDVIKFTQAKGVKIGKVLKELELEWIESGFSLPRRKLLNMLKRKKQSL